jgi:hypothetical protein
MTSAEERQWLSRPSTLFCPHQGNGSGGVVRVVTRLQTGQPGVRIAADERDFSFL